MNARRWGVALAVTTAACAPPPERPDSELIQQGRTYTSWLYESEYGKLWERFSPEMKQTFGSVTELADFAARAVRKLGYEAGGIDERVIRTEPFRVYRRSASFDKSPQRMLIEWSLAEDGAVTGLVVRPAP